MATTRIISLHVSKGKSAGACIKERLDYIMNPEKTEAGALVSTYGCAPKTAAAEFMLYRSEYLSNTGRVIPNEVLGYHVRQAFKPGEITPENANKIGKQLAEQMSGDGYAYVVATHTDRKKSRSVSRMPPSSKRLMAGPIMSGCSSRRERQLPSRRRLNSCSVWK